MIIYAVLLTIEKNFDPVEDQSIDDMARLLVTTRKYFDVMKTIHHVFDVNAYTFLMVLAESHVAIQTYPELGKVFVSIEYHEEDDQHPHINITEYIKEIVVSVGGECESVKIFERARHVS